MRYIWVKNQTINSHRVTGEIAYTTCNDVMHHTTKMKRRYVKLVVYRHVIALEKTTDIAPNLCKVRPIVTPSTIGKR